MGSTGSDRTKGTGLDEVARFPGHQFYGDEMNILKSKAVQASAAVGVVIAICASVGAAKLPVVFAVIGVVWLVATVVAVVNAARSAR